MMCLTIIMCRYCAFVLVWFSSDSLIVVIELFYESQK